MLLHLLACGWFEAPPEEATRTLPPRERLEAALPGLATAAAEVFGPEDAQLLPLAELVDATDRGLVKLLLPRKVQGPQVDLVGESLAIPKPARGKLPEVDLLSAEVEIRGGVLSGSISGAGVEEGGAGLELDLRGGPAPELLLRFPAEDTLTLATMERWVEGPAQAIPGRVSIEGDTVHFQVQLSTLGGTASGHVGAAVARVEGTHKEHTVVDRGPAGRLGKAAPHALTLLRALMDTKDLDPMDDPDLTVAVALGFGAWRGWVAPEVRPVVESDARAWLRYGLTLDSWLSRKEAPWRLAALPAGGKLLWAWPGAQSVAYGALAVGTQEEPLTLARYRFAVPDAETLTAWRDAFPLGAGVLSTANLRDEAIWEDLRYRASPAAMEAVCGDGRVRSNMCAGWDQDRAHGKDLGEVDGVRIPLDGGVSASHQLRVRARENDLVGDCATATTVSLAAMQAVGIPGIAVGYAGPDWTWPTHVQPAFLVGERLYSPQAYPGAKWAAGSAWSYLLLPVLDPSLGAALGQEPGGAARGPGVAGGRMDYGALSSWGEGGIPLAQVMGLLQEAQDGAWPELSP